MNDILTLCDVGKSFTMHLQGGVTLPVVDRVSFSVHAGECVVLAGPSGTGKSSILKMIFGSYRCDRGSIRLRHGNETFDIAGAAPRQVLALRRSGIGYVSQFLRAVPRVAAIDIVAGPLETDGLSPEAARETAAKALARLNLPERLWDLPPATFSGGEQQRVNIARGFVQDRPLLLLDEPTASLDAANRAVVIEMIRERKRKGTAIIAIVHDDDVRKAIADTVVDIQRFAKAA
ncbi:phosphonate C-P lyase system protein PhnL [Pseudorhodoplanes sp.]|uniref:phosphonate C-P lyase system protein PhnL n=1 Tax=Pseudorhodoplanes sp. TaxID=1934341 RepID=UPI00391DD714